jgi:hypothetical protein
MSNKTQIRSQTTKETDNNKTQTFEKLSRTKPKTVVTHLLKIDERTKPRRQ